MATTKTTMSLREEYAEFYSLSRSFFYSIGFVPFPDVSTKWRSVTDVFFWVSYLNLVLCAFIELNTIVMGAADPNKTFVDNVAIVPLVSYTVIGLEQILTVYRKRDRIISLVVRLRELFELHSASDLERCHYETYKRRTRNWRITFASSYVTLIMTFNFISIGRSIVNYFHDGIWFLELPYAVWYPFNARDVFIWIYLQQLAWGFTCILGVLAIDLLLSTLTDQICFEFEALGMRMKSLQLDRTKAPSDWKKIRELVVQHNVLIGNTEEFAAIISFTLLMNFLLISVVMCTVGFQVIATESVSESLKFLLFLMVCLLQTLSLSYFGDRIITAVGQLLLLVRSFEGSGQRFKLMILSFVPHIFIDE